MIWLIVIITAVVIFLLWFSHRYAWWRKSVDWSHPRILMYHMISPHKQGAKFNKMRVTPEAFETQIKWLVDNGFTFVTMQTLYQNRETLTPKTVAITFDDGFADNYTAALPILKKYQAKATIYVVVDRHFRDWDVYKKAHHNTGELLNEAKLTDAQIQEMAKSNLIEIGSHTLTHANLAKISTSQREAELIDSRQALQQLTQAPINSFAYPFGIYQTEDVALLEKAGYQHAVTVQQGIDNISQFKTPQAWFHLKRIKVSGKDSLYAFKIRMRTGFRGWK